MKKVYNHQLLGLFLVIVSIQEQCQAKLRTTNALLSFGSTTTSPRVLSRQIREISLERVAYGTAVQQMVQMDDVIWTTKITLGGQQFTMVVDTGSSDLWLPSIACTSPECLRRRRYDPAKSSSYARQAKDNRTIQIHYGGNVQVYGREARDTLVLGGLKIESQSFLLVHQITGHGMYDLKVDGILGLGYMSLSRLGAPTPFELMLDRNLIENPVFSLAPTSGRDEGLLTFGAPGQGYQASEFKNVSLIEARHWQFELKGVALERGAEETNSVQANDDVLLLEVCTGHTRCKAIADSGAALIIGSSREVRAINEKLGASELANGIFKFASCEMINSLPNLVFTLNNNGDKLVLTPEMYIVKRRGQCVSGLALAPYGGFPFWILGTTFLDNFNTLYDYKNERVGFAPLH